MQAVLELVHPARADWYEEFYAKVMNTTMRSYEAQVRRFWNIHCCLYKVSSHLSETDTYILYGWCVFRCGSKRAHQKDMCSKEIGQCAQNL